MKTFGLITLYLEIAFISVLVAFFIFSPKAWDMDIALAMPFALMLGQLLYAPVIRISDNRFRIFTIVPFYKNINVALDEVQKIIVEVNYTMRFIVHKKDGTIVSTICNRYAYDVKPMYMALRDTGIELETHGVGAIDCV